MVGCAARAGRTGDYRRAAQAAPLASNGKGYEAPLASNGKGY